MKKIILVLILGLAAGFFRQEPVFGDAVPSLPGLQESDAYKQYSKRPKGELSKLIYLMDRFRGTDFKVIYDDFAYDSNRALKFSKQYISDHYKNEPAENWVKLNSYRSRPGNKIIYLKYPDGKSRPLKDALIEELHLLQQSEKNH